MNFENDAALGLSCTEVTRNAAANKLYGKSFKDLSEDQKQLTLLQMVEDANKASGALGQAARESDTWTNVTGNLKQAWTDFQAKLGANVLPLAVEAIKKLARFVEVLGEKIPVVVEWFDKYKGLLGLIAAAIGVVTTAVTAYNIAQGIQAAMNAAEVASLGALIKMKLMSAAATMAALAPYLLITAAIAAVIAIGVALYKNWDTVKAKCIELKDKLAETWENIRTAVSEKVESIKTALAEKWETVKTTVSEKIESIKTAISEKFNAVKDAVVNIFNSVRDAISQAWETIKNVVKVGVMFISEIISAAFQLITLPFRFIWENCKETVLAAWNWIKNTVTNAITGIVDRITGFWNDIQVSFLEGGGGITGIVEVVFDTIANIFRNVMNAIGNLLGVDLSNITDKVISFIQNVRNKTINFMNTVKSTISKALNIVKSTFTKVWNAIKSTTTKVFNAIKTTITKVWNDIKSKITTVVNAIKSVVTKVWNSIKSTMTSVMNAIKSVVSNIWNSIKNTVSNIMNSVKNTISKAWNAVKSTVSNAINNVKSKISSGLNSAKSTVSNVLGGIKDKFTSIFDSAKNIVRNAIDKIKGYFNFSWSLPKIKLPHFKIKGKFSLDPPSVPKFSISWYKKAMNNAMLLNSPTVFGYSAASGKFLGGGEAGQEVVAGSNTLMNMIQNAVAQQNEGLAYYLQKIIEILGTFFPEFVELMEAGGCAPSSDAVAAWLAPSMNRQLGKLSSRKDRGR